MTLKPLCALALLAAVVPTAARTQTDSSRVVDSLASGGVLRGTALRRLPIDDPRQAFTLIPGVVLRNGDIGIAASPDISIRGGLPGQASVYIDGASVRFQTFGTNGLGLAANAIADVSLTTGVAPAVIADAAGGVVSYFTRTGGERLDGEVRWESDDPFGNAVSVGYNRVEASVGGPLPIAPNLSFFLSATLQGQLSRYRSVAAASVPTFVPFGVDTVVEFGVGSTVESVTLPGFVQWSGACAAGSNVGIDCQGLRRPMDWSTTRRVQGKVQYAYGAAAGSALSLTLAGGDLQQRSFPGQVIMNPGLYSGGRARSINAILNWRHQLGAFRGGPLTLDVNMSIGSDHQISGPLTAESEVTTRDPYLGIEFETLQFTGSDQVPLPVTDRLVRNVRTNTGLRVPYLNRLDLSNRQPYRLNVYGIGVNWPTQGINGTLSYAREQRFQGRWGFDWRPDATHRVMFGVDAGRTSTSRYQSAMLNQANFEVFVARPTRFGLFANDRIELGAAVLDVGVRYDRITPGGEFPTTPGRTYTNPAWLPGAATDDAVYASNVATVFTKTGSRGALSPRIRFAYAVSPGLSARLGYGRYLEPPSWATYFQLSNADLDFTNTNSLFGRDVTFATASHFDFGLRSSLGRDVVLEVAAYYKDLPQYVGRIKPFADPFNVGDTINVNVVTLQRATHGVGLDARIDWHAGVWLQGSAAYSLLNVQDITTHAVAAIAAVQAPGDWMAGTFLGTAARDLSAQITLRATSGVAYNPQVNSGLGTIVPAASLGFSVGSARFPWTKGLDLRITKGVQAGGRAWTVYADVRNLLNSRNIRALFSETGDVVNLQHRTQALAPEFANLHAEASSYGALEIDGTTVNLTGCGGWSNPVNCVALTRVERRFGDGNGMYTLGEQQVALNAYYDAIEGPWFFYNSGRTLRIGVELGL